MHIYIYIDTIIGKVTSLYGKYVCAEGRFVELNKNIYNLYKEQQSKTEKSQTQHEHKNPKI